ncbi:MAG TPA: hypothetical protein VGO91_09480 [Pyrinomonadaceae bacterium]|jgi:hypothetical protein|nr:hypothetical protein [Pyrinomonadaceae bacterium]
MIDYKKIIAPENRGILLDVVVFFINLISMIILTRLFVNLMRQANEDKVAQSGVILFCLGLSFLQPIGAILKRRRAHQRNPDLAKPAPGCLFHPIFYFLSKLLFLIAASAMIVDLVFGDAPPNTSTNYFGLPPWLFTTLFLGIPAVAIVNTAIVYFYFWKPKHPPLLKCLQLPQAESLGDVCLFLNMICYQMFWGFLMADLIKDSSGIVDRIFTFGFTALLIYFPPRLFYLAEDGQRPLTWLVMLLANMPVILRILFSRS